MFEVFKNIDKDRVGTGIVLTIAISLMLLSNSFFVIWFLLGLTYLVAIYESAKIFKIDSNYLYIYALILWILYPFFEHPLELLTLFLALIASYHAYKNSFDYKIYLPFLYPTISFILFLELFKLGGSLALLWLIMIVAFCDMGAYFGGKRFGKRALSSSSPNKTQEGVLFGVLIGGVVGSFFGLFIIDSWFLALIISLCVSLISIFGDLFESSLKRASNLKDSGNILPGHGGVLDRLDGYLFGVVVLVIAIRMFG